MMRRVQILLLAGALSIGLSGGAIAESFLMMTTSGCACCHAWARYLRAAGHEVIVKDMAMGVFMKEKLDAGIPPGKTACHTARVAGYVIEGHVPLREIERLLKDKPHALGLLVPGMPIGSPGMEAGDSAESYEVLLLKEGGETEVYARYGSVGR